MDSIADVEIEKGKFKYILIKLTDKSTNKSKYIVRGYQWAGYHVNILDYIKPELEAANLNYDCVGGGRIIHRPDEKKIKIYGYSYGFGQADHSIACEVVKKQYPNYNVEWSNEGY